MAGEVVDLSFVLLSKLGASRQESPQKTPHFLAANRCASY